MLFKRKSVLIVNPSPMVIAFPAVQFAAWQGAGLIQNAIPTLSPVELDFPLPAIPPASWSPVFGRE